MKKLNYVIFLIIIVLLILAIHRHLSWHTLSDGFVNEIVIKNTLNGDFMYSNTYETSQLNVHLNIGWLLTTPFYHLFPETITLITFQILSIGSGAIALSLISPIAGIFYLLHPTLFNGALYDFRPSMIAVGLLAWLLYFAIKKNWKFYYPILAAFLLMQEDMAIIGIALSIYLFKEKKPAIITLISSLVVLIIANLITHQAFTVHFNNLGSSYADVIIYLLRHPFEAFNAQYFNFMLKPFAYLALFNPLTLVAVPTFLVFGISSSQISCADSYHSAILVPILALATYFTLKYTSKFKYVFVIVIIIQMLSINALLLTNDRGELNARFETDSCFINNYNLQETDSQQELINFLHTQKNKSIMVCGESPYLIDFNPMQAPQTPLHYNTCQNPDLFVVNGWSCSFQLERMTGYKSILKGTTFEVFERNTQKCFPDTNLII